MSSNRLGFVDTPLGGSLEKLEYVWVAIFAMEALLKIVAMGFLLHPGAYLRDGWNIVDFIVVLLGFVDLFTSGNLTALRTVRVLRPLRAITHMRGMRVLVTTLIQSGPMLLDVLILCAFTFFIFGLVAVQLFAGSLRYRCAAPDFTSASTLPDGNGLLVYQNVSYVVVDDDVVCSGPMASDLVWYDDGGSPIAHHGARGAGHVCPSGTYCSFAGNPNYGMTSFDHILWAWLTIFQCITQESWTDVLYYTSDAVTWWVWPFFVALVVFGSFYMVNLALAVLFVQFNTDNHAEEQGSDPLSRTGSMASSRGTRNQQHTDGDGSDHGSEDASEAGGSGKPMDLTQEGKWRSDKLRKLTHTKSSLPLQHTSLPPDEIAAMHTFRRAIYGVASSKRQEYLTAGLIIVNTVVMCINWFRMPASVEAATNYINYALTIYFLVELLIKLTAFGFRKYFSDGMNIFDSLVVAISMTELLLDLIPTVSGVGPLSVLRTFRLLRIFRLARSWKELHMIIRAMFKSITSTSYLLLLIVLFMFIAALMGMQLFGYKFMFCDYVEGASPICPLGMRVWGDCPNHFHCFLPCTADEYGSWIAAPGSRFGNQAFCERFCVTSAAAAAADVHAAGSDCEYQAMVGKSDVPRAQFDNLFWGLYSLFQLLTTENWNQIMYDGMRSTTPWAALYFVAVLIIGTYLIFNLFIAILLDNFSGTFNDSTQTEDASEYGERTGVLSQCPSNSSSDSGESMRTDISAGPGDDGNGFAHDDTTYLDAGFMHPLRVSTIAVQQPLASPREPQWGAAGLGVRWAEAGYPSLGPERAVSHPPHGSGAWDIYQPVSSPGAQRVMEGLDSPSVMNLPKGQGRKVMPVDANGRPATAEQWPASTCPHPVSALEGKMGAGDPGQARVEPVPAGNEGASSRRAMFAAVHAEGDKGVGVSLQRSLKGAMSSLKSIKGVEPNEHLVKHIRGTSLLLFSPDHWVRWNAARLVHHSYFEAVILYLIVASSIMLALDTPSLDPDSQLGTSIRIMDYIFTGAFALEALLKIVTFGFAFTGKHAYIRNGWNVLDFLIVLVGFALIGVQLSGAHADNIQMLRVLRTLRALRPLRAASQYPGLKVVVNALFAVLPAMANVALVCLLFYLIFAILAVNLFKGQLYNCIDTDTGERLDPFYVLPPGRALTREWCEPGTVMVNTSSYYAELPEYVVNTA
ncbi:Sodium channel protein type 4 subunit alpha [Tetrabaena socialis]|uniref:Sodium channel protein type 4 subunit alpha n=1 Tax=Tetrabaena socialis TaxID=47790 RepID=A0A2J8A6J9_9CHLO|nr:Sodium channel protein type 4 subunit alpha [Tetrabaena socialis]|eukprot:PNH08113.1 Sodium channel protein type 4 subunit alpha [Tetrabaena socialis]